MNEFSGKISPEQVMFTFLQGYCEQLGCCIHVVFKDIKHCLVNHCIDVYIVQMQKLVQLTTEHLDYRKNYYFPSYQEVKANKR